MTKHKNRSRSYQQYLYRILAISFWLLLWELISRRLGQNILLAPPSAVLVTIAELMIRLDFWQTVLFSALRIIIGFFLAIILGIIIAVGAYNSRLVKELAAPLLKTIQAMPVASFIILALVFIRAKNLSVLASFLMVMPLIYSNVLQGLLSADEKLLEMARVFEVSTKNRIRAIYLPAVMPYFISTVTVGVGLSWKAGIAAEVIGIPTGSIGERLYEAKLYLMTKELFAWTFVIVIISILFEKAVLRLLRPLHRVKTVQEKADSDKRSS